MSTTSTNPRLVSVKLTPVGRPHTFLSATRADSAPRPGERVVVQSDGGPAVGVVVRGVPQTAERRLPPGEAPPRVIRVATHDAIVMRMKHEQRERDAHRIAGLKIRDRGLGMKLAKTEQTFDGSRLIFYFTAEGRVDFRELVRELASEFRAR